MTSSVARTSELNACPCCGEALAASFYEVGPVPVHSCLMLDTAEEASVFPQAFVRLSLCESCGFVTNTAFDPKWSAYAPEYEDQQSFSPTFNSFSGKLVTDLIKRHGLRECTAVEIGCSKGDFLRLLAEKGGMNCVGIDPSVVPGRVKQPLRGSLTFLPDYYGKEHLQLPADLICCRHTLEHIQDVSGTLALMYEHAANNPGSSILIEVPDASRVWNECAFEDIYYEHCSYFTPGSLARALRRAGFAVSDLRRDYGDQYLIAEATLDPSKNRYFEIEETPSETGQMIEDFNKDIQGKLDSWSQAIRRAKEAGTLGIWGSGSKCVAFLRTLGVSEWTDAIFDVNPHRTGRFAPGVPVPISSPKKFNQLSPDTLIIMNELYEDEIRAELCALGDEPNVLVLGQPL